MNDEIKEYLLPCPFCGGEAVVVQELPPRWSVICYDCSSKTADRHGSKQSIIDDWNARVEVGAEYASNMIQDLTNDLIYFVRKMQSFERAFNELEELIDQEFNKIPYITAPEGIDESLVLVRLENIDKIEDLLKEVKNKRKKVLKGWGIHD